MASGDKLRKHYIVAFLGITMVILFFCNFIVNVSESRPVRNNYEKYNQNWLLRFEGREHVIDLPYAVKIPKDKIYSIENVLSGIEGKNQVMVFRSQQQRVRVWIGEELIYRYPEKENAIGLVPGNWNLVKIPEYASDKKIRIEFSSKYDAFSGRINPVYCGDYGAVYSYLRHNYLISFYISAVIGMFGAVVFGFAFFIDWVRKGCKEGGVNRNQKVVSEELLGILLIVVSIWACGESKVPFANISEIARYFITFCALMLIPVFFMAYVNARMSEDSPRTVKYLLKAEIAVFIICVLMQLLGIYDFPEMLPLIQVVIVLSFLAGIYHMHRQIRKKSAAFSRLEYIFVIIIILCLLMEVIMFYCKQYQLIGIYIRVALLAYTLCVCFESIRKIYRTMRENERLAEQLNESRAELMVSQIQPHFIYNTLSAIRTLIRVSPSQAYEMVYDFSNYLRANIDSINNQKIVPFSEELKHIQAYLNIEKVRFGKRLIVKQNIQTDDFYLPPLSVQPLVENAVKHGICKKPQGGVVTICTYETEDWYYVEVEDNGIGFQVENEKKKGDKDSAGSSGIENIRFRIAAISHGELEIVSEIKKGTKATIRFPKKFNRILLEDMKS